MERARFIAYHVMKAGGYKATPDANIKISVGCSGAQRTAGTLGQRRDEKIRRGSRTGRWQKLNPKAYEEYMAGKKAREQGHSVIDRHSSLQTISGSLNQDDGMAINDQLTLD